jgi:hypothetical protein
MYQLRKENFADSVAIYGRGRELFRLPTYVSNVLLLLLFLLRFLRNVQTGSCAHQPSYTKSTGTVSSGVKRPGRKAAHLMSFTAAVKNEWSNASTLQYLFVAWYLLN